MYGNKGKPNDMADWGPIWSPDGKDVAFGSTRESIGDIFRKPVEGQSEAPRFIAVENWFEELKRLAPTDGN